MADLTLTIFNQFVDILGPLAARKGCCFNECDLDYRLRCECGQKKIEIRYLTKDKCCREQEALTSIDITNICLRDLTLCDWIDYLRGIAKDFVDKICPKAYVIMAEQTKCRRAPDVWCPGPCRNTTRIIQQEEPVPEPEHVEYVTECCECPQVSCHRQRPRPINTTIVQYAAQAAGSCCSSCAAH